MNSGISVALCLHCSSVEKGVRLNQNVHVLCELVSDYAVESLCLH